MSLKRKLPELLFDIFTAGVSFFDVATDLIVTVDFYRNDEMTFFWVSVAILLTSQILYASFFLLLFADRVTSNWKKILVFFVILPFAQLVPFFIFLDSLKLSFMKKVKEKLGLKSELKYRSDPGSDPMKNLLRKKLHQHGGFLIETLAESVPESILQMTAMVLRRDISPVSVASICLSITSVASKAYLISYCVDRYTFAFNFLCFVYDIFSVYCTVSWLFATEEDSLFESLPTVSYIWIIRFAITAGSLLILSFLWYLRVVVKRRESIKTHILLLVLFCLVFGPFLIVVESFKLSLLPVAIYNSVFDSKYSKNRLFYVHLLQFLSAGDFEQKMYYTNRVLATHKIVSENRPDPATDWILDDDNFVDLATTRKRNKMSLKTFIPPPPQRKLTVTKAYHFFLRFIYFFLWILVPILAFNAIYGFLYPYLRLITDYRNANLLQIMLTSILGLILLGILGLCRKAYLWGKTVAYLFEYQHLPATIVAEIKRHYENKTLPEIPVHLAGKNTKIWKLYCLKLKIGVGARVPSLIDLCALHLVQNSVNWHQTSLPATLKEYLDELLLPTQQHPKQTETKSEENVSCLKLEEEDEIPTALL